MNRMQLYTKIALTADLPEFGLLRGDIADIAEIHHGKTEQDEFLISIQNGVGDRIIMLPVKEHQVRELRRDEILHVRPYHTAALAEPLKTYMPYQKGKK